MMLHNARTEFAMLYLNDWRKRINQLEAMVIVTLDAKKQCALTKFGFTAERPDGETGQGNAHAPGAVDELNATCAGGCAHQTTFCFAPWRKGSCWILPCHGLCAGAGTN